MAPSATAMTLYSLKATVILLVLLLAGQAHRLASGGHAGAACQVLAVFPQVLAEAIHKESRQGVGGVHGLAVAVVADGEDHDLEGHRRRVVGEIGHGLAVDFLETPHGGLPPGHPRNAANPNPVAAH